MDRLSGTYALFITFVGFLIHLFAVGYMHGEAGFYRFFAFLNLFMFAMLTLVLADNFVLMFVGWEGVGLCSYLLIGYYFDKKEAGDAAKKAFITNRIGDWGFVLGIMLTFFVTGSVSFFANPAAGEVAHTAFSFFKNCYSRTIHRRSNYLPVVQPRSPSCCLSARPVRARRYRCTFGFPMRWLDQHRFQL